MSKTVGKVSLQAILALVLFTGCNNKTEQQLPQAPALPPTPPAVPGQLPPGVPAAAQPVAAPTVAAPPATPLIPIGEVEDTPSTPSASNVAKKIGGGIDKPLPGPKTSGDELVGGYSCRIDSKKLQIGPIKLPPFGCRIYKAADGSLKVGSTSSSAGSFKGNVKDQTAVGFFITGKFEMAGNSLTIKSKMKLSGATTYSGNGRGRLNGDKKSQIKYKLTMTRN